MHMRTHVGCDPCGYPPIQHYDRRMIKHMQKQGLRQWINCHSPYLYYQHFYAEGLILVHLSCFILSMKDLMSLMATWFFKEVIVNFLDKWTFMRFSDSVV